MFNESLLIVFLKLTYILLNEDLQTKVTEKIAKKIKVENVAEYYQISGQYGLVNIAKSTLDLMKRCFSMVAETNGFKELPFNLVKKILASSSLKIDTEIEVFKAAESWLNFNYKNRSKYAKDLLLKVRFPLLSDSALKSVITKNSSLFEGKDCIHLVKSLTDKHDFKGGVYKKKNQNYFAQRYCNQSRQNILVCYPTKTKLKMKKRKQKNKEIEKEKKSMTLTLIDSNTLTNVKSCKLITENDQFELVTIRGEVYIFTRFCKSSFHERPSVFKCSTDKNYLSTVGKMPDNRDFFSVCAFMDNIFVIGGRSLVDFQCFNTCLQFDVERSEWTEVCGMKATRMSCASSVFEGRIIVSGGKHFNNTILNSVEAYDPAADSWSNMPDMVEARYCHRSVAMGNKLFVIGNHSSKDLRQCEVFDSTCNKFTLLKSPKAFPRVNIALIGNKITVFDDMVAWCYDVIEGVWSEKDFVDSNDFGLFSCTVVSQM